jgi:hypothetical protein
MFWKALGILTSVCGAFAALGGVALSLRRAYRDF